MEPVRMDYWTLFELMQERCPDCGGEVQYYPELEVSEKKIIIGCDDCGAVFSILGLKTPISAKSTENPSDKIFWTIPDFYGKA